MSNAVDPSTVSSPSPSTRRSTRPKRSSDTPKPMVPSTWDTVMSGSQGTFLNPGHRTPRRKNMITQSNPHPWMHPQELRYIGDKDFPQNLLIQYLCSKAFSIPPREANSTIPLFHVTTHQGTKVVLPRGYRVPLMFVAKFQWDSLKLVLTSPDPQKEWEEYKFDIIHLCRLCERLFMQAAEAQRQAGATGAKGIDRLWRSATFDRVLTRFYHRWFVSREWSIRKFWEEFDDDEYDCDILKHDWARWAIKGHKGFILTKDQIHKGITAQQFMQGLSKNSQGTWIWDESLPVSSMGLPDSQTSIGPLSLTINVRPIVVEDQPNSDDAMITQLEMVFDVRLGTGTPSHNTIEVKRERLEVSGESLDKPEAPSSEISASTAMTIPTILESSRSDAIIAPSADQHLPDGGSIGSAPGAAETSKSPIVGQKRSRSPTSNQGRAHVKRMVIHARKTLAPCHWQPMSYKRPINSEKSSSFGGYLEKFKNRDLTLHLGSNTSTEGSSNSSSDDDEGSSGCEEDDPKDDDYKAPRNSRTKASQLSPKSDLTTRLGQASNTSPLTVVVNVPTTSGPKDSQSIGQSCNPPVVATKFRSIPAATKAQGFPSGAIVPSSSCIKTSSPTLTSEAEPLGFTIVDRMITSLRSVKELAVASSGSPDSATGTTTQTLSSSAEALSISECPESAPTPSTSELVSTTHVVPLLPTPPSPQTDAPTFGDSSNSNSQECSAAIALILSHSQSTVADQTKNVSEANVEKAPDGPVVKEDISDHSSVAEIGKNGSVSLNIVTPDVVCPGIPIDRHGDLASAEPRISSTIDTESSPLTGVVPQGCFSTSSPLPELADHMDVDEPVPTNDRLEDLHGMLISLLSDPREIKARCAIFLLRGLLRGEQIQSGSILTTVDGKDTFIPQHHPLDRFADGEGSFNMEEHLELVLKCSSLLSKYVETFKGRELEERVIELDERLKQELSNLGVVQSLTTDPYVTARNDSPVRVDKAVATVVPEDHSTLLDQRRDVLGDCQVEKPDSIVEDSITDTIARQSLTPEATMVDLSSVPSTSASTCPDVLKIELVSGTIPPTTRLMTSMMRNLADLLDCTYGGDNNDVKGKGRELNIGSHCELSLVSQFLNEFKSMKEEMRRCQERSKEEIESIARLHRAEVISLKEQMRATAEEYRRDTELLREQHRQEIDSLLGSFREAEKQREKVNMETEGKLPLVEMLELRRRVGALESHSRSLLIHSPSQTGPSRRPTCDDESDITIIRRPPFHPLGHLFDYEDAASPVPYTSPDGLTSKPGTPIQLESSNAIFIDSIPLPIKSQRKFQSMHRMSLT